MTKIEWILCPVCGNKTRNQIREDTVLLNFLGIRHRKSTSIPMSGLRPRTRKCGKWNGNICSALHVKPPKYRRGRRKSMLLPIHIYFLSLSGLTHHTM